MKRRDAECTGKVRYLTRKQAKKAAKDVKELRGIKGLQPYTCSFCGLFHLGHRPGQATHLRKGSVLNDPTRGRAKTESFRQQRMQSVD